MNLTPDSETFTDVEQTRSKWQFLIAKTTMNDVEKNLADEFDLAFGPMPKNGKAPDSTTEPVATPISLESEKSFGIFHERSNGPKIAITSCISALFVFYIVALLFGFYKPTELRVEPAAIILIGDFIHSVIVIALCSLAAAVVGFIASVLVSLLFPTESGPRLGRRSNDDIGTHSDWDSEDGWELDDFTP